MLALTVAVIPLIGLRKCYALTWVCFVGRGCDTPQCNSYSIFVTALNNGGTFIAFCLYLALYCKAKKIKNRITAASMSDESEEAREAAKEARKRDRRANATVMILFSALIGVTLPAFFFGILIRALAIIISTENTTSAANSYFVFISVVLTNLYLLIFITDPIVIMRNQDVRDVMETIRAKLRPGSGRRGDVTTTTNEEVAT